MVMRLLLKTEKDQNKLKQHKKALIFLREGQIKPQTKAVARLKPTYRAVSSSKA